MSELGRSNLVLHSHLFLMVVSLVIKNVIRYGLVSTIVIVHLGFYSFSYDVFSCVLHYFIKT